MRPCGTEISFEKKMSLDCSEAVETANTEMAICTTKPDINTLGSQPSGIGFPIRRLIANRDASAGTAQDGTISINSGSKQRLS